MHNITHIYIIFLEKKEINSKLYMKNFFIRKMTKNYNLFINISKRNTFKIV